VPSRLFPNKGDTTQTDLSFKVLLQPPLKIVAKLASIDSGSVLSGYGCVLSSIVNSSGNNNYNNNSSKKKRGILVVVSRTQKTSVSHLGPQNLIGQESFF
jgi:hypothetical protein